MFNILNITGSPRFSRKLDHFSNVLFRGVYETAPVHAEPSSDRVLYSLLAHKHVAAYLVALKSFLRYANGLKFSVVVQCDGTLTNADRAVLRAHVQNIEIYSRPDCEQFLAGALPLSVSEELSSVDNACLLLPLKLLNVFYRCRGRYVILFDSDLLFLRPPTEVITHLQQNTSCVFHPPGGSNLTDSFNEMGFRFDNVGMNAFNSGFVGFRNSFSDAELTAILRRIQAYDKALFQKWEIEQAIWCVLLNYCNRPLNLRSLGQGYVGNGWRSYEELRARAVLVHFVGATRFRNFSYLRLAKQVIRELQRGIAPAGGVATTVPAHAS